MFLFYFIFKQVFFQKHPNASQKEKVFNRDAGSNFTIRSNLEHKMEDFTHIGLGFSMNNTDKLSFVTFTGMNPIPFNFDFRRICEQNVEKTP